MRSPRTCNFATASARAARSLPSHNATKHNLCVNTPSPDTLAPSSSMSVALWSSSAASGTSDSRRRITEMCPDRRFFCSIVWKSTSYMGMFALPSGRALLCNVSEMCTTTVKIALLFLRYSVSSTFASSALQGLQSSGFFTLSKNSHIGGVGMARRAAKFNVLGGSIWHSTVEVWSSTNSCIFLIAQEAQFSETSHNTTFWGHSLF
mmetsp:Transcript_37604/g.119839  ORF Transcript_37604/g.119839 Transcript_37604/m.119839 type:complete len:206 (+) Transcript_37604:1042-1659(+)